MFYFGRSRVLLCVMVACRLGCLHFAVDVVGEYAYNINVDVSYFALVCRLDPTRTTKHFTLIRHVPK